MFDEICSFVKKNKTLFENVNKEYSNMKDSNNVEYTILDYEKILNEICQFVEGYVEYRSKGDKKYSGKIFSVTVNFYNNMFTNVDKYRHVIVLSNMVDINANFLKLSKRLQNLMDSQYENSKSDSELYQLLKLTENQYKKISKVYKDDMKIYLWLNTSNSEFFHYDIPLELISSFHDNSTPVIHKK